MAEEWTRRRSREQARMWRELRRIGRDLNNAREEAVGEWKLTADRESGLDGSDDLCDAGKQC